jgi:hypothetical protein
VSRTSSPVPLLNSASRSSSTRPSSVSDEETSRKSRQPAMPAPPGISPQKSVNIQAKTQNSVLRPSSPVSEDEIEDALRRPVSLSPSPSTFEEMKTQGNISKYISRPQPTTNPMPPAFQKSAVSHEFDFCSPYTNVEAIAPSSSGNGTCDSSVKGS